MSDEEPFVKPYIKAILKAVAEAEAEHVVRTSFEPQTMEMLATGETVTTTIKLTIEYPAIPMDD